MLTAAPLSFLVYACSSGAACLTKLIELQHACSAVTTPAIVLIDTPHDEQIPDLHALSASSSYPLDPASSSPEIHAPEEDVYGLNLLQKLITESHLRSISKLVVPVPIISYPESAVSDDRQTDGALDSPTPPLNTLAAHRPLIRKCLDLGAVDVIISPLSSKCVTTLEICAYKAHRDAAREQQELLEITKGRKRSWVGVNQQKPFAYLREAMVSSLMNGICRLSFDEDQIASAHIAVSIERQTAIAHAVGKWDFCAHSFTDDELLVASMVMFKHALAMPGLERWRLPPGKLFCHDMTASRQIAIKHLLTTNTRLDHLIRFLVACRTAYNSFVPYHNFRHVVDVLQATFSFLVNIGALPPYPSTPAPAASASGTGTSKSAIAELLTPFDALTLLVTAIGHDVGHPGVNNGFLTTLNAPLSQLYNDKSVLESFHCAAYSQILRRYWPAAFEDRAMRSLMISSILATDMGTHFDYMKKLGDLQERLAHCNSSDGWNGRQLEDNKVLACALLIKCADISNVARHHETAVKWMHILVDEFSRQASMEKELEIKSSLIAEPKKDIVSLFNAQLGFMNMFAIPLFQGVADVMPAMQYTVDELEKNRAIFSQMQQDEKAKQESAKDGLELHRRRLAHDGTFSPKTRSYIGEDDSSQEATFSPLKTDASGDTVQYAPTEEEPKSHGKGNGHPPEATVTADTADDNHAPAQERQQGHTHMNGAASSFDPVRELAESDPFNCRTRGDSGADNKSVPSGRQRCSETTEGSVSGAFGGDWASQATSAGGKAALSPSTQGTSIVSNDSMDRTVGVATLNAPQSLSPPASKSGYNSAASQTEQDLGESLSNTGSIGRADGKSLRKKPSRFRMKDFPFFRRNKGSSPPFPAADATS